MPSKAKGSPAWRFNKAAAQGGALCANLGAPTMLTRSAARCTGS